MKRRKIILGIGLLLIAAVTTYALNSPIEKVAVAELAEGSGPDAAELLRPGVKAKGPLNTQDLKHIELTDQDGHAFTLDELKGETLLINFMFAGCTSVCPVQTVSLKRVHNEMQLDPEKDHIKLLSISIAPLSDTPEELKKFAKRFEIDKPSWRFAVTNLAHTNELSEQFGVGIKPLDGGQIDHRSLLYLVNHEGVMIQQYRGDVVDVERLKKELRIVDQMGR